MTETAFIDYLSFCSLFDARNSSECMFNIKVIVLSLVSQRTSRYELSCCLQACLCSLFGIGIVL